MNQILNKKPLIKMAPKRKCVPKTEEIVTAPSVQEPEETKDKISEPESEIVEDTATDVSSVAPSKPRKKRKTDEETKSKKSKKPRAPSSYVLFAIEYRNSHKEENKEKTLGEVSKLCGEAWKKLSDDEKGHWKSKSDALRVELEKSIPPVSEEEKKPKRSPTSYVLFSMEERQKILKEYPNLKLGEVSKKCGEAWKALTDEKRNEWKEKAAQKVA